MEHIRWPPPARKIKIHVLLPATFLRDIPHLREKTIRASMIARTLSIFRVGNVTIYRDVNDNKWKEDARLLKLLLEYFKTPPYLKKFLFKKCNDLKYVGITPPLKTPNHPEHKLDFSSNFRSALVIKKENRIFAEAGLSEPVEIRDKIKVKHGDLVTLKIVKSNNTLYGEIVDSSQIPHYWIYDVSVIHDLALLIKKLHNPNNLIVSTSRYGDDIRKIVGRFQETLKNSKNVILVFGSPKEGLKEIFERFGLELSQDSDYVINFIPLQGVKTVRTEEALISTLSIINLLID
ncbi:MAG: RNA methyltransferase [Thermoprotei archaeon]